MYHIDIAQIVANIITEELPVDGQANLCLFMGAGASLTSGADSFQQLKERILNSYAFSVEDGADSINSLKESDNIEAFFQLLFSQVKNARTRSILLKEAFPHSAIPTDGYICTALLCSAGAIKNIITTNFDQYLEYAAKVVGVHDRLHVIYAHSKSDLSELHEISRKKVLTFKIHGDVDAGIHYLTESELNEGAYPDHISDIAKYLIQGNRMLFCGYSGFEQRLAEFFHKHINCDPISRNLDIYWINPSAIHPEAPLSRAIENRLVQGAGGHDMGFDNFMKRLVRNLDPDLFEGKTRLYRPFSLYGPEIWDRTYEVLESQDYLTLDGPLYVKRPELVQRVCDTLIATDNMAMLVGPSGYGKSSLMPELVETLKLSNGFNNTVALTLGEELKPNRSLEDILADILGLDHITIPSLTLIQSDLVNRQAQLIVVVDGLDQSRASIDEIKLLYRDIARFHRSLLREGVTRIRFVLSCRTEVWHRISSRSARVKADISHVTQTLVTAFDNRETKQAFTTYTHHFNVKGEFDGLSPKTRALLSEPILLQLICKAYENSKLPISLRLHDIFEDFVKSRLESHNDYDVLPFLERLAVKWLDPRLARDGCSFGDLPRMTSMGSLLDIAVRTGIIRVSETETSEYYSFFHERILELFIARHLMQVLEDPMGVIRFDHDQLLDFMEQHNESKHAANVIKLFLTDPRTRRGFTHCLKEATNATSLLLKECILTIAQSDPEDYADRFLEWYYTTTSGRLKRALIQAAATTLGAASKLWDIINVGGATSSLMVPAIHFLVDSYRKSIESCSEHPSTQVAQMGARFQGGNSHAKIFLNLLLVARVRIEILPTNVQDEFYKSIWQSLGEGVRAANMPNEAEIEEAMNLFGPKYLFNATARDFTLFFSRTQKEKDRFEHILKLMLNPELASDKSLRKDVLTCIRDGADKIERILLQPVFIQVARQDFPLYKKTIMAMLHESRDAREADFCSGNVAYQLAANDFFDHSLSYTVNEYSLKERPDFFLREKAYDTLFNPIGTYGFTYPLRNPNEPIDLYATYIARYCENEEVAPLLRMLHAIRQTLTLTPTEGLQTLRPILTCKHPDVRDRLVRVLAEGYAINPTLISNYVYRNENLFTTSEIVEILCDRDHDIHMHPITILEWGRVYRFLLSQNDATQNWHNLLFNINRATSLQEIYKLFSMAVSGSHTR
ncbi:SIR2 family protein [Desulfovibrio caledoniensis]